MSVIDSLEIEIQSKSSEVSNTLDLLVEKLEKVSKALEGISVSKSFQNLENGIKNVSSNIADIGNGVKNFSNAISASIGETSKKTKAFSASMSDTVKILEESQKKLQTVSISLNRTGSNSNIISKQINQMGASVQKTSSNFGGLASSIAKFYAVYKLSMRGIKNIWKDVENAFNYTETYNFLNVAIQKIGKTTAVSFGDYGEQAAEYWTDNFQKKINQLTQKMTGFEVGTSGELLLTSEKSLGIDPNILMGFQAKVLSVTNSVGLMGKTSIDTAKSLSMLAGDLSSLTNTNLDTVMTNLSSGLIGQSRALYKYGIDITNATLQTYAYANGIDKSLSAMTQGEKMQLRLLAILDQSRIAWGDLANTVSSASNSYRIFQQQVSNLGRTLGNLFLPIVQNVLPYINGLVIAMQRFFQILGFKIYGDNWLKDTMDGISGASFEGLEDSIDDTIDGLEDANSAAKKLKSTVLGIDELNINNPQDGTDNSMGLDIIDLSSQISFALGEYEDVWNEAFANMENKTQEIAERISKALKPITDIFESMVGNIKIGNWFAVGEDVSNLVSGIFTFFSKALKKVNWGKIGKNTADFLNGMLKKISGKDIAVGINSLVNAIWNFFSSAIRNYNFGDVLRIIGETLVNLDWETVTKLVASIAGLKMAMNLIGKFSSTLISESSTLVNTITNGASKLSKIMSKGIVGVGSVLGEIALMSDGIENLITGTGNVLNNLAEIGTGAALGAAGLYAAFGPAGFAIAGIAGLTGAIIGAVNAYDKLIDKFVNDTVFDGVGTSISKIADSVSNLVQNTGTSSETMQTFAEHMQTIDNNTKNSIDSIEKFRGQLNNPDLKSSSETINGLKTSVDNLSTSLKEKLETNATTAYEILVKASGDAVTSVGEDIEELVRMLGSFQSKFGGIYNDIQAEADAILDKMLNGNATEEDVNNLNGLLDDLEYLSADAIKRQIELQQSVNDMLKIDFGSVKETTAAINKIKETGVTKLSELDTYYGELTSQVSIWQEEVKRALEIGRITDEEATAYFSWITSLSDVYNTYWNNEKTEVQKQIQSTYDYIETQITLQGVKVAEEAEKSGKTIVVKITNLPAGATAVENFSKNIYDPISEAIQEAMNEINPEAEKAGINTWESYKNGIYSENENFKKSIVELMKTNAYNSTESFKEEILNQIPYSAKEITRFTESSLENVPSVWENFGVLSAKGYGKGIVDSKISTINTMKQYVEKSVMDTVKNTLGIHSPSRVFEAYAENTVIGFNNGILNNKNRTFVIIEKYIEKLKIPFASLNNSFYNFGYLAMQGLYNGLLSMEQSLYSLARSIANNIANTIKSALEIHSPSKVMFQIGDYTMQGFQLGMESLYKPIQNSLSQFGSNLEAVTVPKYESIYAYGKAYTMPYENYYSEPITYQSQSDMQNYAETNSLLRELISAVREDKRIDFDDRQLVSVYNRRTERNGYLLNRTT